MNLPALVCRYADRCAALGDGGQQVSSPLGAWLVLALAAPAAAGELAEQLIDALGTDADTAHRAARDLLGYQHPAVLAAAAVWTRPGLSGLDTWLAGLPAQVTTGAMPTQEQADSWAREHTLDLIRQFPLDVDELMLVLASALATKVSWLAPFELADGAELRGPWGAELTRVLRAPRGAGHAAFIADTSRAGRVAAHSALADGLDVTSVVAEAGRPRSDVLAAAHEIAVARAGHGEGPRTVSLFDLPLGEHELWTITEEHAPAGGEYVQALVPAWHAESRHDLLTVPSLGFGAAGKSLSRLAGLPDHIEAIQTAVARYGRRGFEAAAVTAVGASAARIGPPPGPYRTATVRFGHPYAVVATARGAGSEDPWHGLPVFAAWISQPEDAED